MTNIIVPGKKKQVRILIGQPLLGGITIKPYVSNMDLLIQNIIKQFTQNTSFTLHSSVRGGTYLDVTREGISDTAIEEDYDYLFFADADMVFKPDIIEQLYARHKEVIGAIYCLRRGKKHGPSIYDYIEEQGSFDQYKYWPVNKGVIKVGGIATGILLIKVSALKKIPPPRFAYLECITPDEHGNRRRLGEDFSFCIKCRENGINIYADTDRWTGHVGEKVWTYQDFQMSQIITKEGLTKLEGMTVG